MILRKREKILILFLCFISLTCQVGLNKLKGSQKSLVEQKVFHLNEIICNPGCRECNELTGACHSCLDHQCTTVQEGMCVCGNLYEKPNHIDGMCEPCYISGCASCEQGKDLTCSVCLDKIAKLKNGYCVCPDGQKLNKKGFCQECKVRGCSKCSEDSILFCQKCIDPLAKLEQGKCVCQKNTLNINVFGYCSNCLVEGCDVCTWSATECHKCKDPAANLVDGFCVCPSNKPINSDGICQTCNADFCTNCVTGNPQNCSFCHDNFVLKDGTCQCPSGMVEEGGMCNQNIPCCVKYENGVCVQSNEQTDLIEQECICHDPLKKINSTGSCVNCVIGGCVSCSEENVCQECKDPQATVVDGRCECPEGKVMGVDEMCTSCQVPGCKTCSEESNEVCVDCVNCNEGKLEDGKCTCMNEHKKPNTNGKCGYCFVEGCAKCSLESDRCEQCIDKEAKVDEDGKCVCKNGMKKDGTCLKVTSSACPQDQVMVDGTCKKCTSYLNGCQTCSSIFFCKSCLDSHAIIFKGKCYCQNGFDQNHMCILDPSKYLCEKCSQMIKGCKNCSSPFQCTQCLDRTAVLKQGKCSCPTGFKEDGTCKNINT